MKILVANLGSTSFKFRLFDFSDGERQLARGSIDRIGLGDSNLVLEMDGRSHSSTIHCDGHSSALRLCLDELNAQCEPGETLELDGIGFKAVHGGRYSGVQIVTEDVLDAMSELNDIAPAHNPIYVSAMRELRTAFPNIPLVAAFETGFHLDQQSVSRSYAIPGEWSEDLLIQKWGFHGASHRYISQRIHQLATNGNRVISMHLGGSSSLCAIRDGKSVQTSMGMSPQSGLPQSNRVGDFDPFSLPRIMERTDKTLEEVLALLANESGLLGVSGVSGDIRDLEEAASKGNDRAGFALDLYVSETRRHLGGLMVALGGVDQLVFTGGTGENGKSIRRKICQGLDEFGIELDETKNDAADGECRIEADSSRVQIWVIPTNEEIVVARQSAEILRVRERVIER